LKTEWAFSCRGAEIVQWDFDVEESLEKVVSDGYSMRDFTIPKKQNRELKNAIFASSRLYHLPCLFYACHFSLLCSCQTALYFEHTFVQLHSENVMLVFGDMHGSILN